MRIWELERFICPALWKIGRCDMFTMKRTMAATIATLAALVAYAGYDTIGPGRYAELEDIQARLRALPGVERVEAFGHEDISFEVEGFAIHTSGQETIAFGALDQGSFEATQHLVIEAVGPHRVIVVCEGSSASDKPAPENP